MLYLDYIFFHCKHDATALILTQLASTQNSSNNTL